MAEKRTRRRFAAEFKAQAVQRLLEDGKGLSEAATELGLSPGQLSLWRNEHLAAGSAEALALRKAEQAEVQRLKRENKRLEEEVEIRKKAAALPPSLEPVALGGKFAPGGSREQVRLRGGRAGEPCRGHAVPDRRRQCVRLLRLAARDPCRPEPGRGGGRAARPHRPHLRRAPAGLRLAAGPRRAAPRRPAPLAPACCTADARDGARRPPGASPKAAHDRQPPRSPGRPEPARAALRRRVARHGLAGRPLLPPDRRGLALSRRHQGHGHAPNRWLEHGRSPAGRTVRRRSGHGPAALPAARGADPSQRSRCARRIQVVVATAWSEDSCDGWSATFRSGFTGEVFLTWPPGVARREER